MSPRSIIKPFPVIVYFHVYIILSSFIRLSEGIVFPSESRNENDFGSHYVSSLETNQFDIDSNDILSEENRQLGDGTEDSDGVRWKVSGEDKEIKESKEGVKWKGWNYLDTKKGYTPHEKTISLQFLDDDTGYSHAPPAWPHDEYLLQFPRPNYQSFTNTKNETGSVSGTDDPNHTNESEKEYEWKRLRPRPPKSMFIGPGFYDDYGPSSSNYLSNYHEPTHQAITDGSTASVVVNSENNVNVPNAVSESTDRGKKYYPGGGYGGNPYDNYRRKRLRLKIHPGLLAAPIAGFAAYKAVSAIASKPLLFELGWVNNKPNVEVGGWGWNQGNGNGGYRPYPPYYPPVHNYPPVVHVPVHVPVPVPVGGHHHHHEVSSHHHGHHEGDHYIPKYPILRPNKSGQDSTKSSWWNPFAALTPRFRSKKERNCCST